MYIVQVKWKFKQSEKHLCWFRQIRVKKKNPNTSLPSRKWIVLIFPFFLILSCRNWGSWQSAFLFHIRGDKPTLILTEFIISSSHPDLHRARLSLRGCINVRCLLHRTVLDTLLCQFYHVTVICQNHLTADVEMDWKNKTHKWHSIYCLSYILFYIHRKGNNHERLLLAGSKNDLSIHNFCSILKV